MNRLQKMLEKWNFKKIVIVLAIVSLVVLISGAVTVGVIYRERISFAVKYSTLDNALKKGESELYRAVDDTASSSSDVVDILVLDSKNKVLHSAKNTQFATDKFTLTRDNGGKYFVSEKYPDTVFKYADKAEFLVSSVLNRDFSQIRNEFDEDCFYEENISDKTVYMLNCVHNRSQNEKIYVITAPTSVPFGMLAIKCELALAAMFFAIYWVLVALWMYRDAARSKFSPLCWGLIGLLTNLVGLIVYKVYKRNFVNCDVCGSAQNRDNLYCSNCGSMLGNRCPECGCKTSANENYCHHCGQKIE